MNIINADAYESLEWIVNHSEEGFFFVVASDKMQKEIVTHYDSAKIAIYDYKKLQRLYSFIDLEQWINKPEHASVHTIFLLNFQLAIQKGNETIPRLNFSRDMLARLKKNILFFVTKAADDALARKAYDLYSYIKFHIYFEDETVGDWDDMVTIAPKKISISMVDIEKEVDFQQSKELLLAQAISLMNQAEQLSKECLYDEALICLMKTLIIREKILGKEHPDTASAYNNIALIYDTKGVYDLALEFDVKALNIYEKILGKEHPDTAMTYNNIALVYKSKGEYDLAVVFFKKALDIYNKIFGEYHPNTAMIYNNIAVLYENKGDVDLDFEYTQKALDIYIKVFGENHPNTAMAYSNIAILFGKKGDYDLALEYNTKALVIREKFLGKEHPDTATTYHNIALIYDNKGDYDLALEYNTKALAIREKFLGREHPDTALTCNNIALVYQNMCEYEKSLEWYKKSYCVLLNILGTQHPHTQTVLGNLYESYTLSGKKEEDFKKWLELELNNE